MKYFYIVLGSITFVLAILGIFLPILPTTPFLLVTAWCWFRGSDRLYNKLITSKRFGPYIRNFRENRKMPRRAKIVTIAMLWITITASAIFATDLLWLRLLLLAIAIGVTIHVSRY